MKYNGTLNKVLKPLEKEITKRVDDLCLEIEEDINRMLFSQGLDISTLENDLQKVYETSNEDLGLELKDKIERVARDKKLFLQVTKEVNAKFSLIMDEFWKVICNNPSVRFFEPSQVSFYMNKICSLSANKLHKVTFMVMDEYIENVKYVRMLLVDFAKGQLEKLKELETKLTELSEIVMLGKTEDDSSSKYIDYKDLQQMAYDNGYSYISSNGSHDKYKHMSSNKIVIIPSHTVGFGLSIAIQKQILDRVI